MLYFSIPSFVDRIIVWKEKKTNLSRFKKRSILLVSRKGTQIYISSKPISKGESNSPRRTIKVFQLGRDLKSIPWFIPFLLSRNNFVKFSLASLSELIKLLSVFGRKRKKKIQHITCPCDPPRPLCPLRAHGLDRATLWFLLSCQVRMGFTVLKVSGLSLYPKHPSRVLREAEKLCIAIYFKCLIKISWKQEVRGKE